MDGRQISMALILRELEIDPTSQDFRLKKNAIYLAKQASVHAVSEYFFWWHYSGRISAKRMSSDFLAMHLGITPEYDETKNGVLDAESKQTLAKIKPLVKSDNLELLTSAHFLVTRSRIKRAEIKSTLSKYDIQVTEEQVRTALSELERYNLLPVA